MRSPHLNKASLPRGQFLRYHRAPAVARRTLIVASPRCPSTPRHGDPLVRTLRAGGHAWLVGDPTAFVRPDCKANQISGI